MFHKRAKNVSTQNHHAVPANKGHILLALGPWLAFALAGKYYGRIGQR